MKKFTLIACTALFASSSALTFAGNKCEVIIPGDHTPKHFHMAPNVKEGDYLLKTIIFNVKPQYRQNCKVNSVDNLLPLQDFLQSVGAVNLGKIYPHVEVPAQERNALGQKLVDLSLIYSFKYTSDINLEKAINAMLSLGYFEYVEPWYVPKVDATCIPNDLGTSAQYHLQGNVTGSIDVRNTAFCTQNGNTSIIIGITDTGTELNHPDLAANVFHNTLDPINGVDDDNDGFMDDYNGWDVGMNDNDPTWQGDAHGVATSGDADAVTNNGTGVASPGFNCKFMECKIADAAGALVAAYQGIQWLADYSETHGHGKITVISCSWGGTGGGSYGQSIIDYAAINKNILVCASAGNNGVEDQTYPSSYNNVYRVASTTSSDAKSGFSSYGLDVDYCAPGSQIYSTYSGGGYAALDGTSMACPVSAGAAALIESQFNYTGTGSGFQIGEKMKQTCDPLSGALWTAGKLGKGRIDVNNALTQAAKSLMPNPITITDGNDNVFMPNENLSISALYTNYLDPSTSAASATLSVVSGPGTVTGGSPFTIGALATLATKNQTTPFTVNIQSGALPNALIKFKLTITDGSFSGSTYFDVTVNPDYINITINDVYTTVTSKGRIGYNNDGQAQGLGFVYQIPTPQALLYESSLMIGVSGTKVSDEFRGGTTGDVDFGSLVRVSQVTPAVVSDFDADGKFNDAPATTTGPIPVEVHHSAYAWASAPYRKFVIFKYVIKNTSASALTGLYAGIMSDWDVPNANSGQDKAVWDPTNNMGYVYWVGNNLYAATKLLTGGGVTHYVVDNVAGGNTGVDPTAGTPAFDTQEKYTALSTNRNADGFTATGGDVMNCVSNGPFTINAGDSVTVAFALIGGDNVLDIQNSACMAQQKWDNTGPCVGTGINEVTADNFWMDAYPNPASGNVNISYNFTGSETASLTVINSLGETVMTKENLSSGTNTVTIDISKLSAGNYLYQLKAGDATLTKKFSVVK